ncbi:serine/threonine protein kinase [Rivibacter subsaxonicus]|uniref:Stress response kinase A n=1 Tax=Rivibacter subsaxonicus TaxID=457575 RepID=A0A4V2FUH4_9BURK|nr:serine/threonine protein kinase [Rivibacter subsaxonicus]RZU02016.1 Ser/Thr protein kinase RdoA (MazF antagonist) [Rivibacter subsaxonicus]
MTPDAPAAATAGAPFSELTPHRSLDLLDAVGQRTDGRLLQLNSYENRVVLAMLEGGDAVVAKFYRPGRWSDEQILEEHGFARELAEAEIPVVAPLVLESTPVAGIELDLLGHPPTLARVGAMRYSVSPRRAGRAPELDDPETLTWIGRFLGRIHAIGRRAPFRHRRRLDIDSLGHGAVSTLVQADLLGPEHRERWLRAATEVLKIVARRFEAVDGLRWQRVHGDCHPGNLLWSATGPHFVDLDDCGTGVAVHDFWMLLSGDPAAERIQLACLLEGYEDFCDFDRRELQLVEPLRALRMLHHSAWIAQRWSDPAFPVAFPWFGSGAYWEQQVSQLHEQLQRLADG